MIRIPAPRDDSDGLLIAATNAYKFSLRPATRLVIDRFLAIDDQDALTSALRSKDYARVALLSGLSSEQVKSAVRDVVNGGPFVDCVIRAFASLQ